MGVPTAFCLLGILTCSFFLGAKAGKCLNGWQKHEDNCYRFISKPVTLSEAEMSCQKVLPMSHLASITSAAEADFVSKYIKEKQKDKSNVWIGLFYFEKYKWKWADLSAYKYKAWKTNEPTEHQCVALSSDSDFKQWIPIPCNNRNHYICKQESIRIKIL